MSEIIPASSDKNNVRSERQVGSRLRNQRHSPTQFRVDAGHHEVKTPRLLELVEVSTECRWHASLTAGRNFVYGFTAIFVLACLSWNWIVAVQSKFVAEALARQQQKLNTWKSWNQELTTHNAQFQTDCEQWLAKQNDLFTATTTTKNLPANAEQKLQTALAELQITQQELAQIWDVKENSTLARSVGFAPHKSNLAKIDREPNEQALLYQYLSASSNHLRATELLREQLAEQKRLLAQMTIDHPEYQIIESKIQQIEFIVAEKIRLTENTSQQQNDEYANSRIGQVTNQFASQPGNSNLNEWHVKLQRYQTQQQQLSQIVNEYLTQFTGVNQKLNSEWEQSRGALAAVWQKYQTWYHQHEQQARTTLATAYTNTTTNAPAIQLTQSSLYWMLASGLAGGIALLFWEKRYRHPARTNSSVAVKNKVSDTQLDVAQLSNLLGSEPMVVLTSPSFSPATESLEDSIDPAEQLRAMNGLRKSRSRFTMAKAVEAVIVLSVLSTLIIVCIDQDFGSWLATQPLTAWGKWFVKVIH